FQCSQSRRHFHGLLVTRYVSILHLADLDGLEALEKSARPFRVELRVTCFDAKKKTVDRSALEFRHVEDGMIRLRQPIQDKDGQKSGERGNQDSELEHHRNEMGPAIKRAASYIERIKPRHRVPFHE